MLNQSPTTRSALPTRSFYLAVMLLFLCLLLLLLPNGVFTQATETCAQPSPGIIAWWPLDETSGTTVGDIADNNPGVHVNGPVPAVGQVDGALRFDGVDDYVGVGDSDLWAFGSNDFTIDLWANFDVPGGGSVGHPGDIFIGSDEGPGTQNKWFFALGGGVLNFHINGPSTGSFFLVQAPFSPNIGQWYHLAVTRNGNTYTIFVDGTPIGSEVNAVAIPNANAPLTIGQAESLGFMNGLLDEVTIYNRAVTQGELQAIFDAGSAGKCKALSISTKALSAIQLGTFSTQTLEARFGSAPFNWSIVNGTSPSGMTLTPDGELSGIPSESGSFPVTIRLTDSLDAAAEKNFVLDVLLISPPSDVRIHKTGTLAVPGRTLDYFILVENVGTVTTSNSEVLEVLNPSSFFELTSTTPPAAVAEDSVIFWVLPPLEPGQAEILSYSVRLNPAVPLGTTITGGPALFCKAGGIPNCIVDTLAKIKEKPDSDSCKQCTTAGSEQQACNQASIVCSTPELFGGPKLCLDQYRECRKQCEDQCDGLLPDCGVLSTSSAQTTRTTPLQSLLAVMSASAQCNASDQHEQPAVGAIDPNEKAAIARKFIQPDQLLVYPIHFENIGNAEARDVFVTDMLDPNLDASTLNLLTQTGGSFNVATRTVKWDLLNRNLEPGETGNVLLSIRPRPELPSGTVIRNSATIQFEVFQPFVTNEVVNIIDSTRPTSVVNALPAEISTLDFPISWSGSDAVGEIDFYSILVSADGGSFTPFLERTRQTSATFRGELGKTYGFLSIATDTAGNIEVQSATAEATTRIVASADADLAITQTVAPNPVLTGSNVTYTITVANNGPSDAAEVTLTDNLPDSTTFVSCSSAGGGVCGGLGNNRTVTFPSLAAGESATITLVSLVNCSLADNTTISNTATVSSSTADPVSNNNSAMATTIASNPPPVITDASVDPSELWPPEHQMVGITVNYNVSDNCGPLTCTLNVTSNEPINGTGDGDTAPDWEIVDAQHVRLRAERAGNGLGRIYTVTINCTDSAGNSTSKVVRVLVPRSQDQSWLEETIPYLIALMLRFVI